MVRGMIEDALSKCNWPQIPSPYAEALRAAVGLIFERFEPQAIVAAGSVMRGAGDRTSDLDIFVVHDAPYKQRLQRWFEGVPAEIFVNPLPAIREYFAAENQSGRLITAHILATGFPVFDTQVLDSLKAEASDWLAKRSTLTPAQDVSTRYTAATLFEDAEDIAERDPTLAGALLGEAVLTTLRYYLRARNGVIPRTKDLFVEVERADAEVARLARRCFEAIQIGDRAREARALADLCLGAHGFFEWESERIPVSLNQADK
jgi:predicted nucleotidyltransferase